MQKYGLNELREMFLDFFEKKGHLRMKSFSLIPNNDKSLLLINSGMAPLKPYFTGQEVPPRKRVTTCQKCIRTGDIENVGKTARHGTFFEMLGNFSFGDYFKTEAIEWSWEFLTEVVGLPADRLYPSVYVEDDEAFEIWNKKIGIAKDRIFKLGKEDNFWEHGSGPCGPSSEIYYDRGEKYGCGKPGCTVGCECDRYIEVWNNVFSQFDNDGNGNYTELIQKNIDTGMGLERLATVVQDVDSIFDVDTVKAIRDKVCDVAGVKYMENPKTDVSIRLITDHIRSVTFMISDGIMPSNEGRGYVLRRLLRRAARHGRLLAIKDNFLTDICEVVIRESESAYPELPEKKDYIFKVIKTEEDNFNKTIDQGLNILADMTCGLEKAGKKILSGEDAFKLYDTYGFPIDLTKEILIEKGFDVDEEGFQSAMDVQRKTARNAREESNFMGADVTVYQSIDANISSEFVGYDNYTFDSVVTVLTTNTEIADSLSEGMYGTVITEKSPFYATMGGQCADIGLIETDTAVFRVEDTVKINGDKIGHYGKVVQGTLSMGESVRLTIDKANRILTAKNHSATHLLQKALKIVLGNHVQQAGSMVDSSKLRFDFTHFSPVTPEEIKLIENVVNEMISKNLSVDTKEMDIDEARKTGATALFGEKYGDTVRVVSMGDFSIELCGGTHVSETGTIRAFKIISESGIASGVRRIEALTDKAVFDYYSEIEDRLNSVAAALKADSSNVIKKAETLNEELRALRSENESLKMKLINSSLDNTMKNAQDINGVSYIPVKLEGADMNSIRNTADSIKEKSGDCVIVIASVADEKVNLLTMASDGAVKKGAHAGNLIKSIASIVGGGGGGRPNMAQAGGKDPAGVDRALDEAAKVLAGQLS
ncbi:MAG: alanine--tRNA ligase [Lachnospiraceae bacterium]|nr:alanine--tRNA ligase [Lachnospiraceae bacterium]